MSIQSSGYLTGVLAALALCAFGSARADAPAALQASAAAPSEPKAHGCDNLDYPREARRYALEGVTTLALLVDAKGVVSFSRVLRSSGWKMLDDAAEQGYTSCRFTPGTRDGVARASWMRVQYKWVMPTNPGAAGALHPASCQHSALLVPDDDALASDSIVLRFLLSGDGDVSGVKLERGSGDAQLDRAAVELAKTCRYDLSALKTPVGAAVLRFRPAVTPAAAPH